MMKLLATLRLPASSKNFAAANLQLPPSRWFATLLGAALAFYSANASAQNAPPKLLTVETAVVRKVTQLESQSTYTGTIGPRRKTALSSETLGLVDEIMFDAGDKIQQGNIVCQLNIQRLTAQLHKLQADRRAAEATLAELNAGPRPEQISASKSRVQELEIHLDQAKRNLARREQLYQERLIASESVETARTAMRKATAAMATAQYQLDELLAGTRQEQIDTQAARVAAIQAGIESLEVELAHSQVKAPYDAVVVERHIDEGAVVSPGQPLLTILETDQLEASIGVPVDIARSLSVGDAVSVIVAGAKAKGTIRAKLHNVRSESRTQDIVVTMPPDASERFVPGQLAQIQITATILADGFLIPQSALLRGLRGLWECYVVRPDGDEAAKVQKCSVEVVKTDGSHVLVKGKLRQNDQVVASALHRVTPGQLVKTVQRTGDDEPTSTSNGSQPQHEGRAKS